MVTKMHPVMNKLQAHMALASQSHHHKIKHFKSEFSPPSQIISSYATFGGVTSNPFWHHGHNTPFHMPHPHPQDSFHHQNIQNFHKNVHHHQQKQQQQQQHQQQQQPQNS